MGQIGYPEPSVTNNHSSTLQNIQKGTDLNYTATEAWSHAKKRC